jgi:hypothetical protein
MRRNPRSERAQRRSEHTVLHLSRSRLSHLCSLCYNTVSLLRGRLQFELPVKLGRICSPGTVDDVELDLVLVVVVFSVRLRRFPGRSAATGGGARVRIAPFLGGGASCW